MTTGTDADAISASYAEGRRDERAEGEREAGILRDALAESEKLRAEAETAWHSESKAYGEVCEQADKAEARVDELDKECTDRQLRIYALQARVAALTEALEEYGSHQLSCPLAQWSHGRPTKDGGYETMYAGKWYQRGDKPPCTCGFNAALAVKEGK